ncbi:MAG: UDP-N-acetylmuramate dehydrogenase, partial [Flavobacteriia bacterium]|nr:UDP-N-acetylmuramate dehydrogenase [Flavobacteriia bacterium]
MHHLPNSFQISASCTSFFELETKDQILSVFNTIQHPYLILGGGSNILPIDQYQGTVIQNKISGITILQESQETILIEVGAGMNWHEWVMHAVNQNWGGIENLALIPGTVGASPMQNIGAYGVEVKDTIVHVNYYHISTGHFKSITNAEAQFGYRTSIFKTQLKNDCLITSVVFKLTKINHQLHLHYGSIGENLQKKAIEHPTIADVAQAVIEIRQSKLPDPAKIGNAGSFFKNPLISKSTAQDLHKNFPEINVFDVDDHTSKISAASLIEGCGWKGKIIGNSGTYKFH